MRREISREQLIGQPDRQTCFHPADASGREPFVPAIRFARASWMYSKSQAARLINDANNITRERTASALPYERVSFYGIGQRWPHCDVLDSARIIRAFPKKLGGPSTLK
jgi:hypothetical protein